MSLGNLFPRITPKRFVKFLSIKILLSFSRGGCGGGVSLPSLVVDGLNIPPYFDDRLHACTGLDQWEPPD